MTHRLAPLLFALALAACATAPSGSDTAATFVVVRHAEKASETERDPDLSAAGVERARRLGERFATADLAAIYSTDYRRTRQTVAPAAAARGIETTLYDAKLPARELAARLRAAHGDGTVLVAGHSNTVPEIVAALCGCAVEPMPETEYDRISTIRIAADGSARLEVARDAATASASP